VCFPHLPIRSPRALAFLLVSALLLGAPRGADAVAIQVDYSGGGVLAFVGSLGVFDVVTGTETFLLDSPPYDFALDSFGPTGGINLGGLAFQFTSFSSGTLVDTAPFDSVAHLEFVLGDPFGVFGTGYYAQLQEGDNLALEWQVVGIGGSDDLGVAFTFTAVPEPAAAAMIAVAGAAALLGFRRRA
jgi:hypothetical protein